MQYLVAKNGEKSGPLDKDEVYRRLVSGELSGTDLGWHEGMADWQPLSMLIPPQQAQPVFAPPAVFPPSSASAAAVVGAAKSSGMAIASMICGILGLLFWLPCIPAVILGHLALSAIKKSAGALTGSGMAITGLVTGYLAIAIVPILFALAVPAFTMVQQKALQMKVVTNARQLVLGMKQYALEHEGKYPPSIEALYEEQILTDRKLLEFPGSMNVPGQGWEYRGAGLTDASDEGRTIILVTKKPDRTKKIIIARSDGSAEVVKENGRE